MAKTKLSQDLIEALIEASKTLVKMIECVKMEAPIGPFVEKFIFQWQTVDARSQALAKHLDALKDREKNPKLLDRLKKLKGIFKSREDLAKQRADMRAWYQNMNGNMAKLWKKALEFIKPVDLSRMDAARLAVYREQKMHNVAMAIEACIEEIHKLERNVTSLDMKVFELERALEAA